MAVKYAIRKLKDGYSITTNAGTFHMPEKLYNLYFKQARPTEKDFDYGFAHYVADATNPREDYPPQPFHSEQLDRDIRNLFRKHRLDPKDFVDKYGSGSPRMKELWPLLTDEIKDAIAREHIFFHFTSNSADEKATYLEHRAVGGSSSQFFGNPFMGDFKVGEEWQKKVREKREAHLGETKDRKRKLIALAVLKRDTSEKARDWLFGDEEVRHIWRTSEDPEANERMASALQKIYSEIRPEGAPEEVKQLDYVRVALASTQFDENMHAYPEPVRLDFCHDKKVVASFADKETLKLFKPRHEDIALAEVVKDPETGEQHSVAIKTKGFKHELSFTDEKRDWFEKYHDRVSRELERKVR